MPRVIALSYPPGDPAPIDKYYYSTRIPLGDEAEFDSMAVIDTGLASSQGKETIARFANFAQAGASVLIFDIRTV